MYYLQTRYYDSNIGRFINADSALYYNMLGYNMYVYCILQLQNQRLYKNGKLKQTQHYGTDGKAEYNIDYSHPGDKHKFPHKHIWDWTDPTHPTRIETEYP